MVWGSEIWGSEMVWGEVVWGEVEGKEDSKDRGVDMFGSVFERSDVSCKNGGIWKKEGLLL